MITRRVAIALSLLSFFAFQTCANDQPKLDIPSAPPVPGNPRVRGRAAALATSSLPTRGTTGSSSGSQTTSPLSPGSGLRVRAMIISTNPRT